MAGRRLVDAAKLFRASKSIAAKHITLRSQQFDVYTRTSSLAKAVKSQTDRITLTAQAAIALAQRVNEESPPQRTYDSPPNKAAAEPPAEKELHVRQEEAKRGPLPDGTPIPTPSQTTRLSSDQARNLQREFEARIPSSEETIQSPPKAVVEESLSEGHDRDVFYVRSKESKSEPSSLPRMKIPKQTETTQQSNENVEDGQLNQDVFYTTPQPAQKSVEKGEHIPEGINIDVFRTRRMGKMLGANPYAQKPRSNLQQASKIAQDLDQEIVRVQSSGPVPPSAPEPVEVKTQATTEQEMHDFASELAKDVDASPSPVSEISGTITTAPQKAPYELRESRVPSSRLGRLWQYAGLGTSMAIGVVGESLRRATGSAASAGGSLMLSPGNMEILVSKLSRMRGAALKLGQMISIQDMKGIPPEIQQVLQRVQDSADYMPASQRNKVLAKNLGAEWRGLFESFDDVPIAAASIGQVHKAVLRSTGAEVAVKVQYPGVSSSIDSDLSNLSILLTASRLLPKGLYLDKTIANARLELGWECDYSREAICQTRFRDLLADDTEAFTVPKVVPEASGREVLTMELMSGIGVTKLPSLSQDQRDWIGTQLLRLCLREIVEFKFMQTDPNWTNFLYNEELHKIELLDFGASREYPDEFVKPYVDVLIAASQSDKAAIRDLSLQLGYLTGSESPAMVEAHTQSVLTLAEPFKASGPKIYDFRDQTITDRVRDLIPVMVKERLAPPPEETYSLHRKLSGAFLLCARLGSRVPCRELFEKAVLTYQKGGMLK